MDADGAGRRAEREDLERGVLEERDEEGGGVGMRWGRWSGGRGDASGEKDLRRRGGGDGGLLEAAGGVLECGKHMIVGRIR